MTLILSDDSAGRHQTPAGHPERPERYQAVTAAVAGSGLRVERAAGQPGSIGTGA
ncbi:MAG: hypothetical protein ACPG7D_01070 [Candidatus Puniceispirillaceae bacterium]